MNEERLSTGVAIIFRMLTLQRGILLYHATSKFDSAFFDFSATPSPPNVSHHLLGMWISPRCCYACLTSPHPLASLRGVNVQHSLFIANNKIAKSLVVVVRCYSIHANINSVLKLI